MKEIRNFNNKHDMLVAEKAFLEEVRALLVTKVDSLVYSNERLMVQNEILEQDVVDCNKLVEEIRAEMEALHQDRDWLLRVGVVRIMDKLIKHLEFTGRVSRIRHVAFIVGEEPVRVGLKLE